MDRVSTAGEVQAPADGTADRVLKVKQRDEDINTNLITFTIYKSTAPLSKKYRLDAGVIQKQAAAQMTNGTAERVTLPFADLPQALAQADEKTAFGYGTYLENYPDKVRIAVSGKAQPGENILARTKEHFTYQVAPGVLMIDHDPSEYGQVMTADELIKALVAIHPEIAQAARIVRGSVSAGVHKTGEESQAGKGFHIYIPVKNAADIPRYGADLIDRLWRAGLGFIALAKNGAMLERTVIDGAVFSPERLDFVGKPIISGSGLSYTPPHADYIEGGLLDTESLPNLTAEEAAQVAKLKADAKAAMKPAAATKQTEWAGDKVKTMQAAGVPIEKAQSVIKQILSGGCKDLYSDFPLEFTTGTVSVAEVLTNPQAYDGQALADPVEGIEYGRTTAKVYWNDGKPVVNSQAHGGCKYFLHALVTKTGVTGVNLDSTVRDIPDSLPEQTPKNQFDYYNSEVTEVTEVTTSNDAAYSGNPKKKAGVTGVTNAPSVVCRESINRPRYAVYDEWFCFEDNKPRPPGVYYHGVKTTKDGETIETDDYICDPLHVDAGSCDGSQNNFGLMLRFKNQRYQWRKWLMPLDMLSGSCEELRGELLRQGLRIDHNKRNHLPNYLQSQRPKKQLECALKVGWHGDVFVLPDRVIGNRDDIFFQTDHAVTAEYGQRGTLEEWQQDISQYCQGNPLLIFQASTGFAGALLNKCHIDYAGFHIFGDSSKGKSTGHKVSASIWGGEGFRRSWKATSNGLEAIAALHNDGLLALDELGDSDAREVNQTIYTIGNGTGKQRANVKGTARAVQKWRVIMLSNGEKTLESHFQEKGLSVKAGQSVRLLQIPVFGNYGAFDNLHGMKDGRLFSDTLQKNTADYYGTAGIAYLEKLVTDTQDFGGLLEAALQQFVVDDMQPQEKRAARAFALVALAGELATEYQITGWTEGAALEASLKCFDEWRKHRGVGATEDKVILESIRDFIDRFGDSRFTALVDNGITIKADRAGWYSGGAYEERTYLFTSAGLKDATTGYDLKRVIEALVKAGWLKRDSGNKSSQPHRVNGQLKRLYSVWIAPI